MSGAEKDRSSIIVGNFEVVLSLTQTRTIKMSGYVFAEDAPHDINARIDMCQEALDRQGIRCDIQNKEAQKAASIEALAQHSGFMLDMEAKKKTGRPLATVEKQKLDTTDGTVRTLKRQIDSLDAAIKAGKAKLNGAAAP